MRESVQVLSDAVLASPGHTDPATRGAVYRRAAHLAVAPPTDDGGEPQVFTDSSPPELIRLVDTVARHAYKLSDADVRSLVAGGLSEDAVFEIVLAASVGAGMGRLERGLAAVREAADGAAGLASSEEPGPAPDPDEI